MTRRRWGKAGVPLTAQEAAKLEGRRYRRELDEQRAYRDWRAGKVVPYRITIALDFHGLQGPDVDEACGVHEPQVDRWEAGTLYPTWSQLCALAELTGNTPGFFMHQPHQDLPLETSMRFHRVGGQRCDTRQAPPVRTFLPEAITATVEGAPVEHRGLHQLRPAEPLRDLPEPQQGRTDDRGSTPTGRSPRLEARRPGPLPNPRRDTAMTHEAPRLDRTGDPEPPDQQHRPGIDCADGWQLGHTLDDEQPLRCLVCHPEFLPENRRRRLWGSNLDARPRDLSSTSTRPHGGQP